MRTIEICLAVIVMLLTGCSNAPQQQDAQQAQDPETPGSYRATWTSVPELQDVMDAMVEVNAETLWNVAIEDQAPKSADDWEKLDHAAVTLIETGKLLKVSNLAKQNPDWPKDADAFIATVEQARAAVKNKNLENLLSAGNDMNEACTNCHNRYFEDQ